MKKFKRLTALLLALCMMTSMFVVNASAATSTKPQNGTTSSEPFPQGAGGSNSFRIPALTTLSDGTVIAAADARWNTTYDGGGLDTIVSRSSNNGTSWTYTFANYLGDNGNTYNGSNSTAFIDPALAVTADDTIYMLVDLYPYGIALNGSGNTAPSTKKGFDSAGHLLLSGNNHSSYGYYLDGNTIYTSSGSAVSGYTVDAYFNITGTDGTNTNLFFSNSPFKVVRTGFLYLTTSTDKGATWSEPTLLDLKTSSEMVCLVSPGRGLVTANGTIVFPVYSYNGDNAPSSNSQRMSFIYSTNGTDWHRSSEFNYNWASESAVVELADGTLRFFFRNGTTNLCYVDYNMNTGAWGTTVNTGLDTNSNCQISAITYSKTVDGQQVILVSCPTGPSEAGSNQSGASYRLNGKIFVGLVNENKTMNWTTGSSVNVTSNNNQFMYSCLSELADGSVAILYENCENAWGAGSNCYYTMDYKVYSADAFGLTFDSVKEHDYQAVVTAPTCTENGFTTYTCSICGDSYTDDQVEPLGHSYKANTVDATCIEAGLITYTCTACGDTYAEKIDAIGHQYTAVVTAPTCTADGFTTFTCNVCGDSYTGNNTAAHGHDYKAVTVEPTCTKAGSVTYTCTACGDSYSEVLQAISHNYTATVTVPTCTEGGFTTHTCSNCNDKYTSDETAALGHNYESVTVEPTCTESGYTANTCTRCDEGTVYSETAALGHDYTSTVIAATCTEDGYTSHTCSRCSDNYTDSVVTASGHQYTSVVTSPTCTEAGCITYTCTICDDTYTNAIAAPGHSNTTVTVDATCTANGSITTTCSSCGESSVVVIQATGHNYSAVVTTPTCTADGHTTYTCDNCGDSYSEVLQAIGHNYGAVLTAPTCTEGGFTTHTCSNCGDKYISDEIAALGHSYSSVITEATCTEGGYTTYTCDNCGDSYTTDYVEAIGHSYSVETVGNNLVYTCDHCNDTYSESLEVAYSYGKVTAFTSGENYVITLYSNRKYYALSHANDKLTAVQITVSNNQITSDITSDMVWTYDNGKLSYETDSTTYYLYAESSSGWFNWFNSTKLSLSTSNSSSVTISNNRIKIGSNYLRYSGGSISLNRSASTAYIFMETES